MGHYVLTRAAVLLSQFLTQTAFAADTPPVFLGAMDPVAATPGGRERRNREGDLLAPTSPGSFVEAGEQAGPRNVVFEVGGLFDLAESTLPISAPSNYCRTDRAGTGQDCPEIPWLTSLLVLRACR